MQEEEEREGKSEGREREDFSKLNDDNDGNDHCDLTNVKINK